MCELMKNESKIVINRYGLANKYIFCNWKPAMQIQRFRNNHFLTIILFCRRQ